VWVAKPSPCDSCIHNTSPVYPGAIRDQRTAFCRQLAMHLCRRITGKPFAVIGTHFNRDYSTVIHACHLIEQRTQRDAAFRLFIEKLEGRITGTIHTTAQG